MKGWVLHGIGDIRLETVDKPTIKQGEVLVEVKAVGICGSDIPRIYRTGTYSFPLIPGHEFSGVVVEAGESGEKGFGWQGERVGVFPLIPCGICVPCRKKQYEMCRSYNYLGSRRNGGFAEYVAVPEKNLIRLPESVSFETAAMMEPMAVAVHAMRRADLSLSDTVVVWGLGTIGLLVLMFLRERGIGRVLAVGNKEFQRKKALELGLKPEDYHDSRDKDTERWLKERTEGAGPDVFFECVGKEETYRQAIEETAPGGRVVLVGNPDSDMSLEKPVYWKLLRNQLTVTGTWNSSFTHTQEDDWHYVRKRLEGGRIRPEMLISHRYAFEKLEKGLSLMRDKSEDYGKVMIVAGENGRQKS